MEHLARMGFQIDHLILQPSRVVQRFGGGYSSAEGNNSFPKQFLQSAQVLDNARPNTRLPPFPVAFDKGKQAHRDGGKGTHPVAAMG